MKRLYVLYDRECGLCQRCLGWLSRQPAYVPLTFLPFQSPEVECRFPGIKQFKPEKEIVVVSDEGGVWQGGAAWVTCLWALREYREWSQRLAHPLLLPLAFRACSLISEHRYKISKMLFDESASNETLRTRIEGMQIENPCRDVREIASRLASPKLALPGIV